MATTLDAVGFPMIRAVEEQEQPQNDLTQLMLVMVMMGMMSALANQMEAQP